MDIALSPIDTVEDMLLVAAVRDMTHRRDEEADRRRADQKKAARYARSLQTSSSRAEHSVEIHASASR